MGQSWVLFDSSNNVVLEVGVTVCQLICKGWKDLLKFLSIKVLPGTKEAGTKNPLLRNHL